MRTNHKFILMLALGLVVSSPPAGATGAVAGATEFTQIANNILLGDSLIEQMAMVAQETMTATNTLNTYKAAIEDLTGLPDGVAQSMLALLQGDLDSYYKLNQATNSARQGTEAVLEAAKRRAADMEAMTVFGYDKAFYLAREYELAQADAEARRQLDSDFEAVRQNETRLQHLAQVMRDAPDSIKSTVSGFQALNATVGLAAAEAAETNRLLVASRVDDAIKRKDETARRATDAKAYADRLARSKAANDKQQADELARINSMKLPPLKIGDTYSKPSP